MTRAAYLYLGDSDAAEDIVQETFIAAWDSAKKISKSESLRPWLFGVLMNKCRKRLRKKTFVRRWERGAIERRMREEREVREDSRIDDIRQALNKLNEEARAVIILRFERNMSVSDAAQALDVPEGTVKSRTHNALEELRNKLGVNHDT